MSQKRLLFVGGGHAHLYALSELKGLAAAGAETTVVTPDRFQYYSGMGPGLLSGMFRPEEARFDVEAIARAGGATFLPRRVVKIDAARRAVLLDDGSELAYDVASFNTGSCVAAAETIPGASEHALAVKPIVNLLAAREALLARLKEGVPRLAVVGGGPAGVELAGNLRRMLPADAPEGAVTLLESGPSILPALPPKARRLAAASLTARGVRIVTGARVAAVEAGGVRLADDSFVEAEKTFLATGTAPHALYRDSGLAAPDGGLAVDLFLRHPGHPEILGGGDGVTFLPRPLPRVGVYAVREGPILYRNLLTALTKDGMPTPFHPQLRFLLILNMGDGTGVAAWGGLAAAGAFAFAWKKRLDLAFMARFQGAA